MSAELNELAERVEALSGPDREIDAAIHAHLASAADWAGFPDWISPDNSPAYTASIDAAMTLVPEGYNWRVDFHRQPLDPTPPCLGLVWKEIGRGKTAYATEPALALTAAALRSQAASQ